MPPAPAMLADLERNVCVASHPPCCSAAEFEALVQRNLGANAGLDYAGLGALLRCVMRASLGHLVAAGCGSDATSAIAGRAGHAGYHAFRLQRAVAVLRELSAEQQRIMDSRGWEHPQETADTASQECHPHAAELAANRGCLAEAEARLRAVGVPVTPR